MKLYTWLTAQLNGREREKDWMTVSRQSGVPYHTVRRVALGRAEKLNLEDVERLYKHFTRRELGDHLVKDSQ